MYRSLEIELLEKICAQLRIEGSLDEVSVQAIRGLRSHGIPMEDIKDAIRKTAKLSRERVDGIFQDVVRKNEKFYAGLSDEAYVAEPDRFLDADDLKAIVDQTQGELENITRSMAFTVNENGVLRKLPVADAYRWVLDKAFVKIQSGVYSYNDAISDAVRQLADSGLKTVDYSSGRIDQIDTAARRAVMTGVVQLNAKYRENSMDFLKTDLVETTAHFGARNVQGPNVWDAHTNWQGRVFRWARE